MSIDLVNTKRNTRAMSLKKYIQTKPKADELKLIQARIPEALHDKLKARLKKDGVKVNAFFEAAAKAYLDEK